MILSLVNSFINPFFFHRSRTYSKVLPNSNYNVANWNQPEVTGVASRHFNTCVSEPERV